MARRLMAVLLAVCLLAGGCGVIQDSQKVGEPVPVSVLDLSGLEYYGRVEKSAVYFLNENSGTLTAELRTLVINQDTNPAEAAVEQLLLGPSNESLKGVAPADMKLSFIEFSKGVANVYLRYGGEAMQPRQAYMLELAIANTVTDILGASSICVFYNGVRPGFMGYPSAPLRKQTGSLDEAWATASARYVPETQTPGEDDGEERAPEEEPRPKIAEIQTVLYFAATSGDYILPEVRAVKYTDGNYVQALIEELKKGPQDTTEMSSPFASGLTLTSEPELEQMPDGAYCLRLFFDGPPVRSDHAKPEETALSYAALLYTITGFVPGVKNVEVYAAGTLVTTQSAPDGAFLRGSFVGYIGSSAPLYFADTNSDLLIGVPRSMEQQTTWSARARVLELLRGPLAQDGDNVWPVMPTGVSAQDIRAVNVYNDTAYVNLSQHFKDACAKLSAKNEMLLVFSIVNTITAMNGISKVQFMVEGAQTDALAGHLCLSDPFLRNYGIVKGVG